MLKYFYLISTGLFLAVLGFGWFWHPGLWLLVPLGLVFLLGVIDSLQSRQAVRRNFPVIGNFRYLLEMIRPEINQYFVESNTDGTPFNREQRSVAYQRAKRVRSTVPFGTQRDLYAIGNEWIDHSLSARHPGKERPRIHIGGSACTQPYEASLLNISAMSFGSLSGPAIEALNKGAKAGGFYHNTGEGSISPHHLKGGDLVWQVGTGYFGCRSKDGGFDSGLFAENAARPEVKMIELKLSQGAKPGHGGILPASKITPEIASIRGVDLGHDVNSPPAHSSFSTPHGLCEFIGKLRELSGGKPVGFKLCVGEPVEFLSVVRAMHESGIRPDFITVDGAEGGTGAAPLEFANSIGWPLTEGLVFVHNALIGYAMREEIMVVASGKIVTAFDMAKHLAIGADLCNSARGMMFALGCIQARRCHSNDCPVGVATQDPGLVRGLVVENKADRVQGFQEGTVRALMELLGAAGIAHPDDLRPFHIRQRVSVSEVRSYEEMIEFLEPGDLLGNQVPASWKDMLLAADSQTFRRSLRPSGRKSRFAFT
ncbi:MAG: glutamate synthase domain-containing protein 2 [Planctomycetota bacterium]|jgi:glutamate synthase domain-containing protein 2